MNNFLNYIKNNISVFSFLSAVLILVSVVKIITIDTSIDRYINPRLIYYFAIVFACILLLFDRIIKKIFAERQRLNVIQLVISIAFIVIVYFKYFKF